MKILVQHAAGWEAVEPMTFQDEDELQRLLKESPEIIPSDPQGAATETVWCREFLTAAGPIDLLGIGSDGSVTIMECKLARNPQVRREVVGQVLDYASALWGMSAEEVVSGFTRLEGDDPFERLAVALREVEPEWAPATARSDLATTLEEGAFRLLIAVDAMDAGLTRIITYVNSRGGSGQRLKLVALTFPRYASGDVTILVPESFGDEAPTAVSTGGAQARRDWSEAEFLDAVSGPGQETTADVARDLLAWMERRGTRAEFGHGRGGPLYVCVPTADVPIRPFDLNASGAVEILFQTLATNPPFHEPGPRHALKNSLNLIPGVQIDDRIAERATWATFPVSRLADPAAREIFVATLDWVVAQVADAAGGARAVGED